MDLVEELTYVDKGLVEDSEYQYRISAENKVGEGPYSSPCPSFVAKDPWRKSKAIYFK